MLDDPATMDETPILLEPEATRTVRVQWHVGSPEPATHRLQRIQRDVAERNMEYPLGARDAYWLVERLVQAQLALRDILSRLPETGRLNASTVDWMRVVARTGLGEDDGQRLMTAQHARLEMAARAYRDAHAAECADPESNYRTASSINCRDALFAALESS